MENYDAIVIGAGHNGLVAALYLAKAGWKTLVLERNAEIGGAVMSGEITRPGFIHDLYSTNQNLFLNSQVYREHKADLERHGLRYVNSPKPYCNVFPDGSSLRVYQDQEKTIKLLREHNADDADGWLRLYDQFKIFRETLLPLLNVPLPSVAAGGALLNAARTAGLQKLYELGQIVLSSTRELGTTYFATPEARALTATWGMHLDFGPDVSGGAMFPFVETFSDMESGMAIVQGGASHMPEALAGLFKEFGGEIRTEAEVKRVLTDGDRASGVELASGERIIARHAVVGNLTPTVLFGNLLAESNSALSDKFRHEVGRYNYGPGTFMLHLALSGKPKWAAGEDVDEFAYVHIPPYVEDLAETYTQSLNLNLPKSPLLIVGQTSAVDPTRTPGKGQILWIQVRTVTSTIRGDAAGEITARDWKAAKEPFTERIVAKLEQYAPGIRDQILEHVAFTPEELEQHNPNLRGGDSVGGSHHLKQNFFLRPIPGYSTYQTPLKNLYITGASTWPGAGTNATSGYLAAREILQPHSIKEWAVKSGETAATAAGKLVETVRQRITL